MVLCGKLLCGRVSALCLPFVSRALVTLDGAFCSLALLSLSGRVGALDLFAMLVGPEVFLECLPHFKPRV